MVWWFALLGENVYPWLRLTGLFGSDRLRLQIWFLSPKTWFRLVANPTFCQILGNDVFGRDGLFVCPPSIMTMCCQNNECDERKGVRLRQACWSNALKAETAIRHVWTAFLKLETRTKDAYPSAELFRRVDLSFLQELQIGSQCMSDMTPSHGRDLMEKSMNILDSGFNMFESLCQSHRNPQLALAADCFASLTPSDTFRFFEPPFLKLFLAREGGGIWFAIGEVHRASRFALPDLFSFRFEKFPFIVFLHSMKPTQMHNICVSIYIIYMIMYMNNCRLYMIVQWHLLMHRVHIVFQASPISAIRAILKSSRQTLLHPQEELTARFLETVSQSTRATLCTFRFQKTLRALSISWKHAGSHCFGVKVAVISNRVHPVARAAQEKIWDMGNKMVVGVLEEHSWSFASIVFVREEQWILKYLLCLRIGIRGFGWHPGHHALLLRGKWITRSALSPYHAGL